MALVQELRAARRAKGLSQADVGLRCGTTQSAIARLESGGASPRLETLLRYAEAVGVEFAASPPPVLRQVAGVIRERLGAGDEDGALRAVLQGLADASADPVLADTLAVEPPSTGRPEWDALLAAVAERATRRHQLEVPGWTAAPSRFLDRWWFPVEDILGRLPSGLAAIALVTSPPEFRARGIFLDAATLDDV